MEFFESMSGKVQTLRECWVLELSLNYISECEIQHIKGGVASNHTAGELDRNQISQTGAMEYFVRRVLFR